MGVILDHFGLEIEGLFSTRDEISLFLNRTLGSNIHLVQEIHRDASCETPMLTYNGFGLINPPDALKSLLRKQTYGFEIVSKPLNAAELEVFLTRILLGLQRMGEKVSPRTSIHIHIGFPESLQFLKRALALGSLVEPLLFRLAGLGTDFRGRSNASIYSRPLSSGPYLIGEDTGFKYKLNPLNGITAPTMESFWRGFLINYNETYERFHPARYFAWNLYSVLLRGTLEFRFFNLCLKPEWVLTVARLCQSLTELSITEQIPDLPHLNPFDVYKDSIYEDMIERLIFSIRRSNIQYKEITERKQTLMDILHNTPHHNLGKEQVLTHIQRTYSDRLLKDSGLKPVKDDIKGSGYIDIHTAHIEDSAEFLV